MILGLLGLTLAGVLVWQVETLLAPEPMPAAEADGPAVSMPAATESFALPPIESYAEIVERPLFVPERRPGPISAAAPTPQAVATGELRLMGIVRARGQSRAVLRGPDGRTVTLLPGETSRGAKVVSIADTTVVIEEHGTVRELSLPTPGNSPLPPPPVPGRQTVNGVTSIPRIP